MLGFASSSFRKGIYENSYFDMLFIWKKKIEEYSHTQVGMAMGRVFSGTRPAPPRL